VLFTGSVGPVKLEVNGDSQDQVAWRPLQLRVLDLTIYGSDFTLILDYNKHKCHCNTL
jgi:hypothetical protein